MDVLTSEPEKAAGVYVFSLRELEQYRGPPTRTEDIYEDISMIWLYVYLVNEQQTTFKRLH